MKVQIALRTKVASLLPVIKKRKISTWDFQAAASRNGTQASWRWMEKPSAAWQLFIELEVDEIVTNVFC